MKDDTINIFIGYDPNNNIEYHIASQSIIDQTNAFINIIPLRLVDSTGKKYVKGKGEYNKARFQVPYLSNYEGWSIYVDCDFVFNEDIEKLWNLRNEKYDVMIVKHDHKNRFESPEMYWSSLMLFNNKKCKGLTLDYIEKKDCDDLDKFCWVELEKKVGELPNEWHVLCHDGNEPSNEDKAFHFMQGAPWERSVLEQGIGHDQWNFYARKILKDLNFLNTLQDYTPTDLESESFGGPLKVEHEELVIIKGAIEGLSGLNILNEDGVRHVLIENGNMMNGYYLSEPSIYLIYLGIKIINQLTKIKIETDIVLVDELEHLMIRDFDSEEFKELEFAEIEYEKNIFNIAKFIIGSTLSPQKNTYPLALTIKGLELDQYCFGLDLFCKDHTSLNKMPNLDSSIIKKILLDTDLRKRIITEIETVTFFDKPTKKLCIDYIIYRFELLEKSF